MKKTKKFAAFVTGAVSALSVALYIAGESRSAVGEVSSELYVKSAEPTTVEGYRQMFSKVDKEIWAAADVSISVTMRDGRRVWLYGDTFSKRYFMVNSSALVQLGSTIHVSNEGRQLLPTMRDDNKGRKNVYWIESAKAISDDTIEISAAETWVSNIGSLSFGRKNPTLNRIARVKIDEYNNVNFVSWHGYAKRPALDTHFLSKEEGGDGVEGHLFYGKIVHKDIVLDSGKPLITICQNRAKTAYTEDGLIDYSAYRVVFTS